jgi:phosphotransferase system  glucose/maltose/N-acetylglucosamine-specific IIC component
MDEKEVESFFGLIIGSFLFTIMGLFSGSVGFSFLDMSREDRTISDLLFTTSVFMFAVVCLVMAVVCLVGMVYEMIIIHKKRKDVIKETEENPEKHSEEENI